MNTTLPADELTQDAMRPFPPQEFADRVTRIKQLMSERGVDVLLLSDANNMYWTTGYTETGFYHKTFVLVALEDDQPIWIGREFTCAPAARLTTYLPEDHIVTYNEKFATHFAGLLGSADEGQAGGDAMTVVANYIKERGWDKARIGTEESSGLLPYRYGANFRASLPDADFIDATELVDSLRRVKSPLEIQVLRQAALIADASMRSTIAAVKPGARECDVAAEVFRSCVAGTDRFGGFYPEGVVVNRGRRLEALHSNWTDEKIEEGELVSVELAGSRFGYNVGITRSMVLGRADPAHLALADQFNEAFDAVLDVAKVGNSSGDLAAAFIDVMAKYGVKHREWIGYSMGVGLPGQGWGDVVSIRQGETQPLEHGMLFHVVPGFWSDETGGWMMMTSDSFLIEEGKPAEVLTTLERKLFVN